MSNLVDIKVKYNDKERYYDFCITPTGDIEKDESFDTTLNVSLMTDGRADTTEVGSVEKQRGTIVDLFTSKRNGSKLWLLEQARVDLSAKNRAVDYARNSLQFLIDEGFCKDIQVSSKLTSNGIELYITIVRIDGIFDKYRYDTWEQSIYKV